MLILRHSNEIANNLSHSRAAPSRQTWGNGYVPRSFGFSAPRVESELSANRQSLHDFIQKFEESYKSLKMDWEKVETESLQLIPKQTLPSGGDRYTNVRPYHGNQVDMTNGSWIALSRVARLICINAPPNHAFFDLWNLLCNYGVELIVMLTKLKEGGRVKADRYWPNSTEGNASYCNIQVQFVQESVLCDGLIKRTFFVKRADEAIRVVTQLQFTGWPDTSAPASPDTFFRLVDEIEKLPESKLLIHCSAGIGRTGTLVAFLQAYREMKATILSTIENGTEPQIDLVNTVIRLREQRKGMVQTFEQFSFCFRATLAKYKLLLQENHELINASAHRETLAELLTTLESIKLF